MSICEFLFFILALILGFLLFVFANEKLKQMGFKHILFYFKWFLIGKNHCKVDKKYKMIFFIVHKALWSFIILSIALTLANIEELLK